jgi:hypothetical protein
MSQSSGLRSFFLVRVQLGFGPAFPKAQVVRHVSRDATHKDPRSDDLSSSSIQILLERVWKVGMPLPVSGKNCPGGCDPSQGQSELDAVIRVEKQSPRKAMVPAAQEMAKILV